MKIKDRLALLKAGYSKDDITAMIEEEAKAVDTEETPKATMPDEYSSVLVSLANEVKNLKETVQATNRDNVETIASKSKVNEAMDILEGLINPQAKNKEEN